ncbi:hypothetical protein Bca101_050554 [Brassica carinata]
MEVYIDDMLVKSLEAEDHISLLQQAFSTLRKYNMKLNPAKCSFGASFGKFLRGPKANRKNGSLEQVQLQVLRQVSRLLWDPQKPKGLSVDKECESALHELKAYLTNPPLLTKPLLGEVMLLYLAVSEHAVSAVLVREEGNKYLPIYYVSTALLDAETHYNQLEKLALALIVAAPTTIKSQVLADFVAEFTPTFLPALEQERSRSRNSAYLANSEYSLKGREVQLQRNNNESKYEALIAGLTLAHQMGAENIQFFSDSQLIINQVQGEYQAKDDSMIQYLAVAQLLIKIFKSCKLTQIPREQNSQADALANLESTLETNSQMSIPLLVLQWPATLEEPQSEEISAIEEDDVGIQLGRSPSWTSLVRRMAELDPRRIQLGRSPSWTSPVRQTAELDPRRIQLGC